jgi:serine/threonine protein kinase
MYKTRKYAGKKLGKGASGTVYTIKDNKDSILKMMVPNDLKEVILIYKNKTSNLDLNEFEIFKSFIESLNDNHVCKFFHKKLQQAEKEFENEIVGYKHALESNSSNKLKVGNFGVKHKSKILLGFILVYPKTKKHFTIMDKCDIDLKKCILKKIFNDEEEFKKLVIEILQQLKQIQKLNIAHGDIKLDNIMKCNNQYKLIDWGYMRDLNYEKLKNSTRPFLGSCSLYFKVYADGHNGYVNGVSWKSAYTISSKIKLSEISVSSYLYNNSMPYLRNSDIFYNKEYKKYDKEELFEKLKYGLDLHAFGWILYDIIIKQPYKDKYLDFIMTIYKFNASDALNNFKKI